MDPKPGFTPYRRRDQAQLWISPVNSGQVPWTTARCNRLLRPISSRIALLHKHKQHCTEQGLGSSQSKFLSNSNTSASNDVSNRSRLVGESQVKPESDPDWAPENGPRKRLRRTYSSRAGYQTMRQMEPVIHAQKSIAPVEITILKPLTHPNELSLEKSAMQNYVNEEGAPCLVSDAKDTQSFTRESFRKLAKSISPSEWMLIDGLYNGLEALLKATTMNSLPSNIGSRSLFSSCLRKVPDHILEEQRKLEAEDPDTECDVASIVYGDLESYNSSVLEGWKPLKDVVRAHGIAMLATAIKDGSIGASIARGLVILCVQGSAKVEAQILLASLAETTKPLSKPRSLSERLFGLEKSVHLYTLNDFSNRSGHYGFFYRQLTTMFSKGIIPIEWISSLDMAECWNRVIGHIMEGDSHAEEAHLLLKTAVSMAYTTTLDSISNKIHTLRIRTRTSRNLRAKQLMGKKRFALASKTKCNLSTNSLSHDEKTSASITSTVSNLMTVLLSIGLVRSDLCDEGLCSVSSPSINTLVLEALQFHQISLYDSTCSSSSNARAALISMPLLTFRLENSDSIHEESNEAHFNTFWLDIFTNSGHKAFLSERLSTLLCDVAHCCGRAGPKKGFEYLQKILRPLLDPSNSHNVAPAIQLFIRRIAIQAAFEFAEGTSQREQLDWALEMEDIINSEFKESNQSVQGRTPTRASVLPTIGFRWEEGIGEWIAKTPATLAYTSESIPRRNGQFQSDMEQEDAIEERLSTAFSPTYLRTPDLSPSTACKRPWTDAPCRALGYIRKDCRTLANRKYSDHVSQDDSITAITCRSKHSNSGKISRKHRMSQVRCKRDDEADELSTPESSRAPTWSQKGVALGELKNLGSHRLSRRGMGKLRAKSLNGLPLVTRRGRKASILMWEAGENGSEDELVA